MLTQEQRFWNKVRKTDGCWEWTASKNEHGYGSFSLDKKSQLAHRVAFYFHSGHMPIDKMCHTCDNPGCVRPSHLVDTTQRANIIDSVLKGRWGQTKKTHCPRGHLYGGDNLYVSKNNASGFTRRHCMACNRIAVAKYKITKNRRATNADAT